MKRVFIIIAVWGFAVSLSAQKKAAIEYVINGKKVENFDGSQLEKKRIFSYTITKEEERNVEVHTIHTSLENKDNDECVKEEKAPLLLLNGVVLKGKLSDIRQDSIKSMSVFKAGSDMAKIYGEKGKHGVVKIYTISGTDKKIYVVDGKRTNDISELKPDQIKAISVLKAGSEATLKYAGEEGETHSYILIETKK